MKLTEFHWHEALDRLAMLQEILHNSIVEHPVFMEAIIGIKDEDVQLATKTIDLIHHMNELYNMVGERRFKL